MDGVADSYYAGGRWSHPQQNGDGLDNVSVELRIWSGDLVVCTVSMMEKLASLLKMVKATAALKGQFNL